MIDPAMVKLVNLLYEISDLYDEIADADCL